MPSRVTLRRCVGANVSVCGAMDGLLLIRVRADVCSTPYSLRRITLLLPTPENLMFSWGFSEHFWDFLGTVVW